MVEVADDHDVGQLHALRGECSRRHRYWLLSAPALPVALAYEASTIAQTISSSASSRGPKTIRLVGGIMPCWTRGWNSPQPRSMTCRASGSGRIRGGLPW